MKLLTYTAACLGIVLSNYVFAADAQPLHLRGEITAINGNEAVVTARNGTKTTVILQDNMQVLDVSKTSLSASLRHPPRKARFVHWASWYFQRARADSMKDISLGIKATIAP